MASTTPPITLRATDDETLQALQAAVGVLAAKWSVVVLTRLAEGTHRFNELKRKLKSITQRMLTKQLRELEEAGLVSRTVHPVVPPHVDYALTPLGQSLKPVVMALEAWGKQHVLCRDGQKFIIPPVTEVAA